MFNWILVGGSSGLGLAFARHLISIDSVCDNTIQIVSRKPPSGGVPDRLMPRVGFHSLDLAKALDQEKLISQIDCLNTSNHSVKLVFFVGGGPFGAFQNKEFKDHQWAWEVSFVAASRLLHSAYTLVPTLSQICFIGSTVAETKSEPLALSYAVAKRALASLVQECQALNPPFDLRLFSPGYMNTRMLPPNSWPRLQKNQKIWEPDTVAKILFSWLQNPGARNTSKQLPVFEDEEPS